MNGYIYKIINTTNNKYYLGSTINFHKRRLRHLNTLKKGTHHCIHLQRAWDKYGENNFIFEIVEECINIKEKEQLILNTIDFNTIYNVSKTASGGNMIENHPDKEAIILGRTQELRNSVKNPAFGEKNPNWRGGIHKIKSTCMCGNKKATNANSCQKCKNISGEKNPFYGKTHSEETKKLLSEKNKGKKNIKSSKAVVINNQEFYSIKEAAKMLNILAGTLSHRVRSKNPKYINYYFKGQIKNTDLEVYGADKLKKPCQLYNKNTNEYLRADSLKEMAILSNLSISGLSNLAKKETKNYKFTWII